MSGRDWAELHKATRASIRAQPERDGPSDRVCGCHDPKRDGRWWLCDYHDGYDDGISHNKETLMATAAAVPHDNPDDADITALARALYRGGYRAQITGDGDSVVVAFDRDDITRLIETVTR